MVVFSLTYVYITEPDFCLSILSHLGSSTLRLCSSRSGPIIRVKPQLRLIDQSDELPKHTTRC